MQDKSTYFKKKVPLGDLGHFLKSFQGSAALKEKARYSILATEGREGTDFVVVVVVVDVFCFWDALQEMYKVLTFPAMLVSMAYHIGQVE